MSRVKIEKLSPVFSDDRGQITDILSANVKHVGLITSKKGSIRGKHYHKLQTQYTYVLKGKIELTTKDLRENEPKASITTVTEGHLITIPPMVVHVYKALEDYAIIALTTELRGREGYEADTFRVEA